MQTNTDRKQSTATLLEPINIGGVIVDVPLFFAPMAGASDFPARAIAREQGAGLCISEMVTSQTHLWHTKKSKYRLPTEKDPEPRPIQIAGTDPSEMAEAAKRCVDMGAGLIDINMGCPAKKVCRRAAGSALLGDEALIGNIVEAVVNAVPVPVTLKTRTGLSPTSKNVVRVAQLVESLGIQALTIHGRTRACRFNGEAEYETIAQVVEETTLPIIANGDITTPEKAQWVLQKTNAAGLMIGRGAWGKPWLFRQIHAQINGAPIPQPAPQDIGAILVQHLHLLYAEYDEQQAVKFARKHVDRYLTDWDPENIFRRDFNQLTSPAAQLMTLEHFFNRLCEKHTQAA